MTSMSGVKAPRTPASSARSPSRHGPNVAATLAWDPHSFSARTRTCGNALAFGPVSKRPNSSTLSVVSGTSSMNPSTAMSRRAPSHPPFRASAGHRGGGPFEQHPQGFLGQPLPSLGDRRGRGNLPVVPPRIHLLQRPGEFTQHFFIVIVVEQAHRQAEPHHDMRGKPPSPSLTPTRLVQYVLDQIPPDHLRQDPERDHIGQPQRTAASCRLYNIRHTKNLL